VPYTDSVASTYSFSAKLWRYPSVVAWYFISVPKVESARIKKNIRVKRGWGSVRVRTFIGKSIWQTSVFPDSKSGMYLLPVKSSVRRAEGIDEGERVRVVLVTL